MRENWVLTLKFFKMSEDQETFSLESFLSYLVRESPINTGRGEERRAFLTQSAI